MSGYPKKIVILGVTGSIGDNTLEVLRKHRSKFELLGVACDKSTAKLASICREFEVPHACVYDEKAYDSAIRNKQFPDTELQTGMVGLENLARLPEADVILVAVVGTLGLKPALAGISCGKDLALASKEILVMAGGFFTEAIKKSNVRLLPIDSEHNAIFQCLNGESHESIKNIILTASGGMFRDRPLETFSTITPEEATQHPNWAMGKKITVDSATMANKGLEIIEAHWLFRVPPENIKVMIHPTSIIHSLVEFIDGCILAQLSPPSMTFAIQHALFYPDRFPETQSSLDFSEAITLELKPPDTDRYPCLKLAYEALQVGGNAPNTYNAANEVGVYAFLSNRIKFNQIAAVIEKTLEKTQNKEPQSLEEVLETDLTARKTASNHIKTIAH